MFRSFLSGPTCSEQKSRMNPYGPVLILAIIGLAAIAERLTAALGFPPEAAFLVFIPLAWLAWRFR